MFHTLSFSTRLFLGFFSAFMFALWAFPVFIRLLNRIRFGQNIRDDGPQTHSKKQGTPTMGGALLLLSIFVSLILWADLKNPSIWLQILTLILFGTIGFYDDWQKIRYKNSKGLSARTKFIWQFAAAFSVLFLYAWNFQSTNDFGTIAIPFINFAVGFTLPAWLYIVLCAVLLVAYSNAVNLTDGLDGLVIGPITVSAITFLLLILGASSFSNHHVSDFELAIFCAVLIGAALGFLWYNANPAQIFMGDTGSLALGASLGLLSILTKTELIGALLHAVFVAEALSVIIQVGYFKRTRQRIFKMAPLHHHFELCGWPETQVVIRFWIMSLLCAFITLSNFLL